MSVQSALENLSARVQKAYEKLQTKGATLPSLSSRNTYNLSSTIDSIVVGIQTEDKGTISADIVNDYVGSGTEDGWYVKNFEKDVYPSQGKNGISHVKFKYKTLSCSLTPENYQQNIDFQLAFPGARPLGIVGIGNIQIDAVNSSIDSNIQAGNIKNGVTILGVTGNLVPGITPTGNIQLTSTAQTDVTNYATAQVVDADLVAGNIKKDVNILGVTGTYEGSGGGGGGLQGYNLTLYINGSEDGGITIYHPDGTSGSLTAEAYGSATASNVAYFYAYIGGTWPENGCLDSGFYNVLILSDTAVTMETGCILKGSLVNLWNGKTKPIEEINYNDELLCWNFDNGRFSKAKPFWIKKAQKNTFYWTNKFESGKEIKTTGTVAGHRFFDIDKGKFLYNTECVGDLCYTKDGPDRLIEAKYVEGECEFYNIYTNYHMNLFANGILTGFRYNNLYPIKDMKFVKDGRVQRSREEFKTIPDSWFYGMRCSEQTDSVENITSYALQREMIKK